MSQNTLLFDMEESDITTKPRRFGKTVAQSLIVRASEEMGIKSTVFSQSNRKVGKCYLCSVSNAIHYYMCPTCLAPFHSAYWCSDCFGLTEERICPYEDEMNLKYYLNKKKLLDMKSGPINYEFYKDLDEKRAKKIHDQIFEKFIKPYATK